LNRIASEAASAPRRRWLPWGMALPIAAGLLLFLVLFYRGANHPPTTSPRHAQVTPRSLAAPAEAANRPVSRPDLTRRIESPARIPRPRQVAAVDRSAPLPKLEVFPTPHPVTRQERALAQFAARAPQPVQEALARSLEQGVPLTVPSIHTLPVATVHTLPFDWPDATELGPPTAGEN
ncbi:MAG TPA: hypothetical protein VGS10_00965, partial [Terracidiphilus sp.]|nr:hypothetical protein [Terracidiphilus sp.]